MNDAPPDASYLADVLDAVKGRRLPQTHAIEELEHLLENMPSVMRELRRRRAARRVEMLLDFGEYRSVRALAPRVAREVGARPDTVRGWWLVDGASYQPPLR